MKSTSTTWPTSRYHWYTKFCRRLTDCLKSKHLTWHRVTQSLSMTYQTVSCWNSGKQACPYSATQTQQQCYHRRNIKQAKLARAISNWSLWTMAGWVKQNYCMNNGQNTTAQGNQKKATTSKPQDIDKQGRQLYKHTTQTSESDYSIMWQLLRTYMINLTSTLCGI